MDDSGEGGASELVMEGCDSGYGGVSGSDRDARSALGKSQAEKGSMDRVVEDLTSGTVKATKANITLLRT